MSRKNFIIIVVLLATLIVLVFDATRNEVHSNESGAPAARTGSPGDNFLTCTDCHSGPNETFEAGWITSNIPAGGYAPGSSYTITATITRSGHVKFGFEISPQDISGNLLGSMSIINTNETKLISLGKYITHKLAGTTGSGGSKTWSFTWTAPSAGTGDVTFYGAFNATNNGGNSSGDTIFVSTLTVSECQPPQQPAVISGFANTCSGLTQTYSIDPVADATSYSWSLPSGWSGNSTDTFITVITGNSGGTISVNAINSCGPGPVQTLSVAVGSLTSSISNIVNVSCAGGNNGSAKAVPGGGNLPYTYSWNTSPVQNNQTASGLHAGAYSVLVTDAAGCTSTSPVTISEPATISLSAGSIHPSCTVINNGSASVTTISGGTQPYSYSWNTTPVQHNDTSFNLTAGTYIVTVTDANNCIATASATVSPAPAIALSTSGTNVLCFGGNTGTVTAHASGGTNPLNYTWNTTPVQSTVTASNLAIGTYTVTVTDNNSCIKTSSVSITQPPVLNASTTHTDVSCHGGNNGTANVNSSGGTGSYTYSWNTVPVQNNLSATNLSAGTYIVTVTDGNNCVKTASTIVAQPTQIILQTYSVNAACSLSNGSAIVLASGGNPGYSYLWNTIPVQTGDTAKNISAGTYTVIVTDAAHCTATAFVTVSNSSGVTLSISSITNVGCHNDSTGAASVLAIGGLLPYTYLWTPTGDTTDSVSGLKAGFYNITITDSNHCIASSVVTISEPPALISSAGNDIIICSGDSVLLGGSPVAYGGTLPFRYQWQPSTWLSSDTVPNPIANPLSTTTYTIIVTDSNGCISSSQVIDSVNPLPAIPVITNSDDTLYSTLSVNYQWYENGIIINGADSEYFVPMNQANYSVTVSDSNSCKAISADYSFVLALQEIFPTNDFILYPNPADNILNIQTLNWTKNYEIAILDLSGSLIFKNKAIPGITAINISELQNGFYFLRIGNENKNVVKVLVISR